MRMKSLGFVESLESRRLLTAVSWDGGAGASDPTWNNPLNWSTDTVPTAADDVTLGTTVSITFGTSAVARSVTVTAPNLTFASGLLTVSDSMVIKSGATLTFYTGKIAGAATLTVEAGGAFTGYTGGPFATGGDVTLSEIDNYGFYSTPGDHDLGGVFYNYGTTSSIEGGNYYTRFVNEPTGTLYGSFIPNSPGNPAVFGVARDVQGVASAAPFVNKGFVYTYNFGSNPGSGLDNRFGQQITIDLDATPTLGGKWQASGGPLLFSRLITTSPVTTVCDATFSLVDGELTIGSGVNLTIPGGIADGAGLSVAASTVTITQPRVSLGLLELLGGTSGGTPTGGTLSLGTGGTVLRTAEVKYNSGSTLDLGNGTFIDGNQPFYSVNRAFPTAGTPATEPAYADSLRGSFGSDVLTVNASNAASTAANKAIGYARGDGLASAYPAGTFGGLPFDANDFVFRGTLRGDTDLDRDVDFTDLLTLARHYGQTTARGVADGNFDDPTNAAGTVDFTDLLSLARNYGQALTVPAPVAAAADRSTRTARVATSVLS